MGYYVARLKRPYDYRVLIETYIYTQRKDFVHADFTNYYASLLEALQTRFGIRLSRETKEIDRDTHVRHSTVEHVEDSRAEDDHSRVEKHGRVVRRIGMAEKKCRDDVDHKPDERECVGRDAGQCKAMHDSIK